MWRGGGPMGGGAAQRFRPRGCQCQLSLIGAWKMPRSQPFPILSPAALRSPASLPPQVRRHHPIGKLARPGGRSKDTGVSIMSPAALRSPASLPPQTNPRIFAFSWGVVGLGGLGSRTSRSSGRGRMGREADTAAGVLPVVTLSDCSDVSQPAPRKGGWLDPTARPRGATDSDSAAGALPVVTLSDGPDLRQPAPRNGGWLARDPTARPCASGAATCTTQAASGSS